MAISKINQDRCILFPRSEQAVAAIENREMDVRYKIEVIDLDYSSLSKLMLFGFFAYPKEAGLNVVKNSFIKILPCQVALTIDAALKSRKETSDKNLLRLIDRFVEKAKRSENQGLPIWFNT
jgi:hypothetical protein